MVIYQMAITSICFKVTGKSNREVLTIVKYHYPPIYYKESRTKRVNKNQAGLAKVELFHH